MIKHPMTNPSAEEVLAIAAILKKQIGANSKEIADLKQDIKESTEAIENAIDGQSKELSNISKAIRDEIDTLECQIEALDGSMSEQAAAKAISSEELQGLKRQFEATAGRLQSEIGDIRANIAGILGKIPPPVNLDFLSQRIEAVRQLIPKAQEMPEPFDPSKIEEALTDIFDEINDLKEDIEELKNRKPASSRGRGFFGLGVRELIQEIDLSPQLNGVTKTFNIPAIYKIITVDLSSFPNALRKNIDYTYTGTTITFTDEIDAASSLAVGQTCILTVINA